MNTYVRATRETFDWYLIVKERQINYEPSGAVQISLVVERVDGKDDGQVDTEMAAGIR